MPCARDITVMLYQGEVPGGCCLCDCHPAPLHEPCIKNDVAWDPWGIWQAFYAYSEGNFLASGASDYFASSKRVLALQQR